MRNQWRFWVGAVFLLLAGQPLHAQTDDYAYNTEWAAGINWNTNGKIIGGVAFRYSSRLKENLMGYIGGEVVNVKHPKELKVRNSIGSSSFINNKINYLIPIRPQVGVEWVLFRKAPEEGVHLNWITAVGPSIGWLKPYHVMVDQGSEEPISQQFDPEQHSINDIRGVGSPFDGIGNSTFQLGGHLKTGLYFEVNQAPNHVLGIETGFLVEAYPQEVVIMANMENNSTYFSFYVTVHLLGRKRP